MKPSEPQIVHGWDDDNQICPSAPRTPPWVHVPAVGELRLTMLGGPVTYLAHWDKRSVACSGPSSCALCLREIPALKVRSFAAVERLSLGTVMIDLGQNPAEDLRSLADYNLTNPGQVPGLSVVLRRIRPTFNAPIVVELADPWLQGNLPACPDIPSILRLTLLKSTRRR